MNRRGMLALLGSAPATAALAPGVVTVSAFPRLGRALVGRPAVLLEQVNRIARPIDHSISADLGQARAEMAIMKADLAEVLRMRRLCGIPDEPIPGDLMLIDGAGI